MEKGIFKLFFYFFTPMVKCIKILEKKKKGEDNPEEEAPEEGEENPEEEAPEEEAPEEAPEESGGEEYGRG